MEQICLYCCTYAEIEQYEDKVINELFDGDEESYLESGDKIYMQHLFYNDKVIKIRNNRYNPDDYRYAIATINIKNNELCLVIGVENAKFNFNYDILCESTKQINYCPMCGRKLKKAQD